MKLISRVVFWLIRKTVGHKRQTVTIEGNKEGFRITLDGDK